MKQLYMTMELRALVCACEDKIYCKHVDTDEARQTND